jgi:hypothetical protein
VKILGRFSREDGGGTRVRDYTMCHISESQNMINHNPEISKLADPVDIYDSFYFKHFLNVA